jgi:hypothetical protein
MPPKKLMVEYETMRAAQLQKLEQIKEENMEETVRIPKNKLLINVWKNMRLAGFSLREIGKLTDSQFSHVSEELKKLDMSNKT